MASAQETLAQAPMPPSMVADPMSALQQPSMAQPQEGAPTTAPPQGMPQEVPQSPQAVQEGTAPVTPSGPPTTQSGGSEQNVTELEMDPKVKQKVESYVSVLMNELHSPDTRDDIIEILKSSSDPFMTIPQAAMTVNDMAKAKISKQGGKIDSATMFGASQYLVGDLMEIGNTFGIFQTTKEDFPELYQDSLQMYIQRGLKDKSIDPIELQNTAEKFMTENQRIGGHFMAEKQGMPYEPQSTQMMAQVESQTRTKVQAEEANKRSLEAKAQMDQQSRQALLSQQGG